MPDATAPAGWSPADGAVPDPKRWIALVISSCSLFIIVLDNTILNVAVPTIIRDFKTDVSSLQWVISGYSVIFASLLISFGRLGDLVGRRKMFFLGAGLFAVGSLIASVSRSVVQLFLGESLLEGIGAAMMLPATLAIISATFRGRERGSAFAVWGSVAGGAGALGPFIGGVLTTEYSWRWAFRVNVVIAPLVVLAGSFYVHESKDERGGGLDPAGVVAVTVGLVALVFGIIEASRYGWWTPIGGRGIGPFAWPSDAISIVPLALVVAAVALAAFVVLESRRVRADRPVVFDFTDLRHPGFRYGLINTVVLAMGEFGAFFVLPIFLQGGLRLSAVRSGAWLLPAGATAFFGGGLGGGLSRRFGPKHVITAGLAMEATGIWLYVVAFSAHTTFVSLLPGLLLHGVGIGFATSQLTNVVLSDIPPQKAGSASGAAGMVRQVGTALGIALIGAIFVARSRGHGVPDGAQAAVAFAGAVVTVGALLSLLVPNIPPDRHAAPAAGPGEGALDQHVDAAVRVTAAG